MRSRSFASPSKTTGRRWNWITSSRSSVPSENSSMIFRVCSLIFDLWSLPQETRGSHSSEAVGCRGCEGRGEWSITGKGYNILLFVRIVVICNLSKFLISVDWYKYCETYVPLEWLDRENSLNLDPYKVQNTFLDGGDYRRVDHFPSRC